MCINSENSNAWQGLANSLSAQCPTIGKTVCITRGKYKGSEGVVTWHGRDKFYDLRYRTEPQLHMMDMRGREGYNIRVRTYGGDVFFTKANYAEVVMPRDDAEEA
jgi:hypothetical protein